MESNVVPIKEESLYSLSIFWKDGTVEELNNVDRFGPIPDSNLFSVGIGEQSIIYNLLEIRKYSFVKE